jgi:histidinol-phosphate phosphatase family protein
MSFLHDIDNSWTVFLDRDGVINEEIRDDYVRSIEQMQMYSYAAPAIAMLNRYFYKTVVVTNQRCVGRGIISVEQLREIHEYMLYELAKHNAAIDAIYFAPDVDSHATMRKPNLGMAVQAVQDDSNIDLAKSVMVGNSPSDIEFGKRAGMKTVFVTTTKTAQDIEADLVLEDLMAFSEMISRLKNS